MAKPTTLMPTCDAYTYKRLKHMVKNDPNIHPHIENLYIYMLTFNLNSKYFHDSKENLADRFGVHASTVFRWLNILETHGYIYRKHQVLTKKKRMYRNEKGKLITYIEIKKAHIIKFRPLAYIKKVSWTCIARAKQYAKNFYTNAIEGYKLITAFAEVPQMLHLYSIRDSDLLQKREVSAQIYHNGGQGLPGPPNKKHEVIESHTDNRRSYGHDGQTYPEKEVREIRERAKNDEFFCRLYGFYPDKAEQIPQCAAIISAGRMIDNTKGLYPKRTNWFAAFIELEKLNPTDSQKMQIEEHISDLIKHDKKWQPSNVNNIVPLWYYLKNKWWERASEIKTYYKPTDAEKLAYKAKCEERDRKAGQAASDARSNAMMMRTDSERKARKALQHTGDKTLGSSYLDTIRRNLAAL